MLIQKLQKFLVLFSLMLTFAVAVCAAPVSAGKLWDTVYQGGLQGVDQKFGATGQAQDIRMIVVLVIQVLLGFLGLIFVILLLMAGYKYMMSRGDSGEIEEAMASMRNAVIGLLIVLAAYGITVFVARQMINITTGSTGGWLF
jgi:hypothetical protein